MLRIATPAAFLKACRRCGECSIDRIKVESENLILMVRVWFHIRYMRVLYHRSVEELPLVVVILLGGEVRKSEIEQCSAIP